MCTCDNSIIRKVVAAQKKVILKHIKDHKWYRGIPDEEDAIVNFIKDYAALMRDALCQGACPKSKNCEMKNHTIKLNDISDGELRKYIREVHSYELADIAELQLRVLKKHIGIHKWIHLIPDYKTAVADFLNRFGWITEEIYKAVESVDENGDDKKDSKRLKRKRKK